MLTSMQDSKKNYNVYPYHNEHIWENVRSSYLLIERIDGVPGMDDAEKARIKDEARSLLVAHSSQRSDITAVCQSLKAPSTVTKPTMKAESQPKRISNSWSGCSTK